MAWFQRRQHTVGTQFYHEVSSYTCVYTILTLDRLYDAHITMSEVLIIALIDNVCTVGICMF